MSSVKLYSATSV